MTDFFTDNRRPSQFALDCYLIDQFGPKIGAIGVATYAVLVRMAGAKGQCYPAVATIADRLATSESSVRRALTALRQSGLIEVTPRANGNIQTSNQYTIVDAEAAIQTALSQTTAAEAASEAPARSLWDQVVGSVQDAADNAAKVGALMRGWRLCFGPDQAITHAQIQQLIGLAGNAEVVAKSMLKAAAVPDIRSPFGLVRNSFTGNAPYRRQEPARRGNSEAPDYSRVAYEKDDVPF